MKKSPGFTLIEVLVSVVVLSVGIIFVLHAFETSAVALADMRDTIWSGGIAQSEFEKLRIRGSDGEDIGSGYLSGRSASYYGEFTWERRIEKAVLEGAESAEADVRRVQILVMREGSSRAFRYETYVRVAEKPEAVEGGG